MVGAGGAKDIFPEVLRAVKNFVQSTEKGDSVTMYTFESKTDRKDGIYVQTPSDKKVLNDKIDKYEANGLYTHTGEAVYEALMRQKEIHDPNRLVFIVLLTDGIEDTKDKPSALRLEDIQVPPRELRPYTIIVWLGREMEEFERSSLQRFQKRLGDRGYVLPYLEAKNIDNIVRDITGLIPPRLKPLTPELSFGSVEPDEETDKMILQIQSIRRTGIRISVEEANNNFSLSTGSIAVLERDDNQIPIRLRASPFVPDGNYTAKLRITTHEAVMNPVKGQAAHPPASIDIPIKLTVARIPLWRKSLKWIIPGAFGLLIILVIGLIRKRKRYLSGVIEHASASGIRTEVDLSSLKTNRARLSYLSGIPVPTGTDAELITAVEDGNVVVRLVNATGDVRVNNERLSDSSVMDLYNRDTILLGGSIRLTYWGMERPGSF
jgi:hypothetical protein